MKVEYISSSLFTIELNAPELVHLLAMSTHDPKRINKTLTLIFEIGFGISQIVEEKADELCEQRKSQNINSS